MLDESSIVEIVHPDGWWYAVHDAERVDGPMEILCEDEPVVRDISFHIDDFTAEIMLQDRFRAHRRGGCAVVESDGHFPFGAEIRVQQSFRYAANHLRVTSDVFWKRGTLLNRHLGLGGLLLPGVWRRYYCVPPCQHLLDGQTPEWHDVPSEPAGSGMIGHWHRPPLALVFERSDGTLVEVGTGFDVWRWEENLGFGPEAANIKIMVEAEGIRVVREPLMTCEEVEPRPSSYRFTWYVAWAPPGWSGQDRCPEGTPLTVDPQGRVHLPDPLLQQTTLACELDIRSLPWPETSCRVGMPLSANPDLQPGCPCWTSRGTQKLARRIIRKLASLNTVGTLRIKGLTPGPCWDSSHLSRVAPPAPHWDAWHIMDFAEWTRQQLGPDWGICADAGPWQQLPSMAGLFYLNGFRADQDESLDDDE